MTCLNLPEPLEKTEKLPKLPNHKSSFYQLSRRESRSWWRQVCQQLYPEHWGEMMKEYNQAIEDEDLDGIHIQLSALLAHYVWWY